MKRNNAPLGRWLAALLETLAARIANPPQKPADWRRASSTGCTCKDCAALSRFLDDPVAPMARFPLAKERRQHLHRVIDNKQLDTTHTTERVGSPHALVCKKTTGSYDRALGAHKVDLEQRENLERISAWHEKLTES